MLTQILDFIFGDRCPTCNSRSLGKLMHSHYARAYNHRCKQAAGATGRWCKACRTVQFKEPDFEVWLKKQPPWIRPYNDTEAKERYKDF